jgi:site-specific DNA-methyltransferase (adenine-specific)
VLAGDCREVLATLPADSVDAVVTDPPYELEFMGRAWDRSGGVAFDLDTWAAVLRPPGAHMLCFGGTRTA